MQEIRIGRYSQGYDSEALALPETHGIFNIVITVCSFEIIKIRSNIVGSNVVIDRNKGRPATSQLDNG